MWFAKGSLVSLKKHKTLQNTVFLNHEIFFWMCWAMSHHTVSRNTPWSPCKAILELYLSIQHYRFIWRTSDVDVELVWEKANGIILVHLTVCIRQIIGVKLHRCCISVSNMVTKMALISTLSADFSPLYTSLLRQMVRKTDGEWEPVKLVSFCKTSRTNTQSCARDVDSKGISTSKQKYWRLFLHHWFSYLKI